ncbi:MAG: FkbM family methyltransferase [Myxococcota bacterium]
MKLSRLGDVWRLHRLLENPAEVRRARRQREGEIEVRFRDGRRLWLRGGYSDYHVFDRIFLRDEYRLDEVPGRWGTVVDLGANVGCFSCRILPRVDRLIAYEPDPHNFELLRRNLADAKDAVAVPEAAGARTGTLRLHLAEGGKLGGRSTQFSNLAPELLDSEVEVPVTTLEALFDEHGIEHCDLLKIDVEGAEYDILGAAPPELLSRVSRIVGEYHDVDPDDPRTRIGNFRALLETAGFRVATEPSSRHANTGLFFANRD